MLTSRRRPLLAAAFLLLFFGIGVSSASAAWSSRGARFHGRFFAPRTRAFVHARPFSHRRFFVHRPFFHRRFFAPRFAFRPFHRPFRVVRVFVSDPFPRWVFRRVYYEAPYGYYGAYSDPYYYPY